LGNVQKNPKWRCRVGKMTVAFFLLVTEAFTAFTLKQHEILSAQGHPIYQQQRPRNQKNTRPSKGCAPSSSFTGQGNKKPIALLVRPLQAPQTQRILEMVKHCKALWISRKVTWKADSMPSVVRLQAWVLPTLFTKIWSLTTSHHQSGLRARQQVRPCKAISTFCHDFFQHLKQFKPSWSSSTFRGQNWHEYCWISFILFAFQLDLLKESDNLWKISIGLGFWKHEASESCTSRCRAFLCSQYISLRRASEEKRQDKPIPKRIAKACPELLQI
jgi:hypothetical protein